MAMQQPLQITIKDIDHSPAIEEHIRKKAEKLLQFSEDIISCHVVVEMIQKHQQVGKLYNVHVTIGVPGKELATTRNPHENLWIAIRDAFNNMREKLKSYVQHQRRQVKVHPILIHGEVVRKIDDFGFILGDDGLTEYYFNSSNVVSPGFDKLKIGASVHFIPTYGDEGPQARRISAKKH